ncbi:MAG: hypothetical protein RI973_1204 [Bacteroidota bacterium]
MTASLTSVNDCSGFFMDSGGGSANYGPNQSFTTTICPDMSTGTHVQLVFNGTQLGAGDDLCFFDGNSTSAPALACASDFDGAAAFIIQATAVNTSGCLTVTFTSDGTDQQAGWSADINCVAACQTIIAELSQTTPAVEPADTGWIDICPGERVFFWGKGQYPQNGQVYNHSDLTCDFEWDFGDGTFTFGPNVSHVFSEPGGYIVQLKITDQLGCTNNNFISQRVRVAPKPQFSTGDWPDEICAGDTLQLNAMLDTLDDLHTVGVLQGVEGFQTGGIRSDSLPLPDGDGTSYTTSISLTGFSPGQTLSNLDDLLGIFVNMEHSWMRDLQIKLTCPNGQSIVLHNHPGQVGGQVFLGDPYEADEGSPAPIPGIGYEYGWSSDPDFNFTWIGYANAFSPGTLPAGTYQPFQPLTNLLGCPLNGDWTIEVTDLWAIDNGYIFSWSIEFDQELYPSIEVFSPAITSWGWVQHPSIFFYSADSISASPQNAGEIAYTFAVEDEFGCSWDTSLNIQVLPFTHPDCRNCDDLVNPEPDTTVCQGQPVSLDVSVPIVSPLPVTFESYDDYPIGAANHPPSNPYNSVIQVNSLFPNIITNPATTIVSVCLDLETDFVGDIKLALVSPNNQVLQLVNGIGGGNDNFTQTCFTPTSTVPISAGVAPYTGNFSPQGSWTALNNAPVNGNWKLRVTDAFGINSYGNLNWWSITFNSQHTASYTWTPFNSLSCGNCPNPVATPGVTTNYVVTGTDNYGCSTKDTVNISVLNSFTAPAVNIAYFSSGTCQVSWNDISPGLNYEVNINGSGWVPSNNGNLSHLVYGLENGDVVNAQVRTIVIDGSCQTGIGNASFTYLFCPITASFLNPAPYSVTCFNLCDETVQLGVSNAEPPFNFNIYDLTSGAQYSQSDGNLQGLCPGNYQVIVSDVSGCQDTVFFSVGSPPAIQINASQTSLVSCSGSADGCATVSATGGTGSFTYLWNNVNMSTGPSICTLPEGPISVTAFDQSNCPATDTVVIASNPPITVSFTNAPVSCKGGSDGSISIQVGGGSGNYTFQWSNGTIGNQLTLNGLSAGNYGVTITDASLCQALASTTVTEPVSSPAVMLEQTLIGCFGSNNSQAGASAMGGTPPYSYSWSPGNQNQATANNLAPGNYLVVVTDSEGCTATGPISIQEWPAYDIIISALPPSCHNASDAALSMVVLGGGDGSYTYQWNTGSTEDFLSNLTGGMTYTVTVTDGQGCTASQSRTIDNPPPMAASASSTDAECYGEGSGQATVVSVLNAAGNLIYNWGPAANNQSGQTATGLNAGTYQVTVTDANGCTAVAGTTVGQPTAISPSYYVINNSCYGYQDGSIDLSITGGTPAYTIAWSTGATTTKVDNLFSGWYQVTITDGKNCTLEDSVLVDTPEPVNADPAVKDVSCYDGRDGSITMTTLGGTPPYQYSLDGNSYFSSSTLIALEAGEYQVFIRDAKGCIYKTSAAVGQPQPLLTEILVWGLPEDEFIMNYGDSIPLTSLVENASGTVEYIWEASYCGTLFQDGTSDCDQTHYSSSVWAKPSYSVDYFLTVIDEKGCEAKDMVQFHVKKERNVQVPTGFSPNSDGNNDLLSVHGKAGTLIKSFSVFDRWGELLFEDTDIPVNDTSRGWDGTFRSKEMPGGIYVWYIEALYPDGMKDFYKGETTLLR